MTVLRNNAKVVNKGGARPGAGQPKFAPTEDDRNAVMALAAIGVPHERICLIVINPRSAEPISTETLLRAFSHELSVAQSKTDLMFATSLITGLKNGDHFLMGLYARNRLSWDRSDGVKIIPPGPRPDEGAEANGCIEIHLVRSPLVDENGVVVDPRAKVEQLEAENAALRQRLN